eukprot:TRINITY_DN787_c0_g2_i1.p1 TRINITY_DN787_c0_g2~~TRINITY_DN787_c0_g2_i1.p1  ORF type:complete len:362 (-),score=99.07 TRINITY_DN787_c0_g2_i1:175-1260(-)
MNSWLERARAFAEEASKRSQEIASETARKSREYAIEAAKVSQELAVDAARKSREYAVEAAKSADVGLKALVKDFQVTAPLLEKRSTAVTEEELMDYGITEELREFVKGITIGTFQDFPLTEAESIEEASRSPRSAEANGAQAPKTEPGVEAPSGAQDLSPWQEHHAILMLRVVEEISQFRYQLCPRKMTDRRFWRIYFLLVRSHVAPYEQCALEKAKRRRELEEAAKQEAEAAARDSAPPSSVEMMPTATATPSFTPSDKKDVGLAELSPSEPAVEAPASVETAANAGREEAALSRKADEKEEEEGEEEDKELDLDEYLKGALGDEEQGDDADGADGDFDPDDFDKLVNDAEDNEEANGKV